MTFEAVLKKKGMWTLLSFILAVDALHVGTMVEGPVGAARRQDRLARPRVVDTASEPNVRLSLIRLSG